MIISAGINNQYFFSKNYLTTSSDGIIWDAASPGPFPSNVTFTALAGTTNNYAAAGSNGMVAISSDLSTWVMDYLVDSGMFSIWAMTYANGHFMAVGQHKYLYIESPYTNFDEAAEIFVSDNGQPGTWKMVFSEYVTDARFFQIRFINGAWIAVGQANNLGTIFYSLGDGADGTWVKILPPAGITAITDVCYVNGRYYFSANGRVMSISSFTNPDWILGTLVDSSSHNVLTAISASSNGTIVAVNGNGIYSTLDNLTWNSYSLPGYGFRSVVNLQVADQTHWIVGCFTNLVNHSLFRSIDAVNWVASDYGSGNIDVIEQILLTI